MANPKKLEYTALVGLVLQVAFLLTCWVLSGVSNSRAVAAENWHLVPGLLVWVLVLVHGRQRRLAREEREERAQLREARLSEELFEETELDTMRASAGLVLFEKWLVPFFTVLLSGGLLYLVYRSATGHIAAGLMAGRGPEVTSPVVAAVGMVLIAFGGFLIGKFAAGLSQSREFRLLRAGGGYVLGNVIACVLIAISMALYHFGITWAEGVVAFIIPVLMALVGIELLLNLVLDLYRPRVPGQERRPPYDSRLLGLFAEPEGVLKTIADTLDYQFGFKVSETWFYRFMERALVPLLLIQLLGLWALTTVGVVGQREVAFVEVLGRPYVSQKDAAAGLPGTVLQPGFHLKWPWPFARLRTIPAHEVQQVEVGKVYELRPGAWDYDLGIDIMEKSDFILWRERHIDPEKGYEVNFLVPSTVALGEEADETEPPAPGELTELPGGQEAPQVNLARAIGEVHVRVRNNKDGRVDPLSAFKYCYNNRDVMERVKQLAYRALCRIAASQDFLKWIAEERVETVRRFNAMLEDALECSDLGMELVFAGITVVHPPPETAAAYEEVVSAHEEKESLILEGEILAAQMVQDALAFRSEQLSAAGGYAAKTLQNARAEKDQFLVRLEAFGKSPDVYLTRSYFDAVEEVLDRQVIYVVPPVPHEVDVIDLQERLKPQLLRLDTSEE